MDDMDKHDADKHEKMWTIAHEIAFDAVDNLRKCHKELADGELYWPDMEMVLSHCAFVIEKTRQQHAKGRAQEILWNETTIAALPLG